MIRHDSVQYHTDYVSRPQIIQSVFTPGPPPRNPATNEAELQQSQWVHEVNIWTDVIQAAFVENVWKDLKQRETLRASAEVRWGFTPGLPLPVAQYFSNIWLFFLYSRIRHLWGKNSNTAKWKALTWNNSWDLLKWGTENINILPAVDGPSNNLKL